MGFWHFIGWLMILISLEVISERIRRHNKLQQETNELLRKLVSPPDSGVGEPPRTR